MTFPVHLPTSADIQSAAERAPLATLRMALIMSEQALANMASYGGPDHRRRLGIAPILRQQIQHLSYLLDAYDVATDADIDHDNIDCQCEIPF